MKKTTFKNIELPASISYEMSYMEYLDANEISYSSRTIPFFQPLLPPDIIEYNGYELIYRDKTTGAKVYAYPFVTKKWNSVKCITFLPEKQLDNLFLLDLEQALRTGQLVFESRDTANRFPGFDLTNEVKIEELLGKCVDLNDGSTYEFTAISDFPAGISGKRIFPNGDAVDVFLAKIISSEPFLSINEANGGWQLLNKEDIIRIFGEK